MLEEIDTRGIIHLGTKIYHIILRTWSVRGQRNDYRQFAINEYNVQRIEIKGDDILGKKLIVIWRKTDW